MTNGTSTYLSIDFGTTQTAAAGWVAGDRPKLIALSDGKQVIPSTVFQEGNHLVVGGIAANALRADPLRGERTPKRKLRHGSSALVFGTQEWSIYEVVGRILQSVYRAALDELGQAPEGVCLTRPVSWAQDGTKENVLRAAAAFSGIHCPVSLVSESEAAARHLGLELDQGQSCLVYDLGGGTCDIAVMEMTDEGLEVRAYGEREIGGETFDALLLAEMLRRLAEVAPDQSATLQELIEDPLSTSPQGGGDSAALEWRRCLAALGENVRHAKEQLSFRDSVPIFIPQPVDREWTMTREELESLVGSAITETVEAVRGSLNQSGVTPSVLYLAGAASAMPLVRREVAAAVGLDPVIADDPKGATALGGLRVVATELVIQEMDTRAERERQIRLAQARTRLYERDQRRQAARAQVRGAAEARRVHNLEQRAKVSGLTIGDQLVRNTLANNIRLGENFETATECIPPENVVRKGLAVVTNQRLLWGRKHGGEIQVKYLDRSAITATKQTGKGDNQTVRVMVGTKHLMFMALPAQGATWLASLAPAAQ